MVSYYSIDSTQPYMAVTYTTADYSTSSTNSITGTTSEYYKYRGCFDGDCTCGERQFGTITETTAPNSFPKEKKVKSPPPPVLCLREIRNQNHFYGSLGQQCAAHVYKRLFNNGSKKCNTGVKNYKKYFTYR